MTEASSLADFKTSNCTRHGTVLRRGPSILHSFHREHRYISTVHTSQHLAREYHGSQGLAQTPHRLIVCTCVMY
ncbi:unnamed protein product [Aphanomyces euteiches]